MGTQTSYFQNDILAAAQEDGSLPDLFWFVEAEYPRKLLPAGVKRIQPAMWPHGFLPVLPAGPDPDEQRQWAELLAGLFASGNSGRGIAFKPAITSKELLEGVYWYEFGEQPHYEVDCICPTCGQVMRAPVGVKPQCECYTW